MISFLFIYLAALHWQKLYACRLTETAILLDQKTNKKQTKKKEKNVHQYQMNKL